MTIELIKNIAAVVGCISAIIALVVTIFKPIRSNIGKYIAKKIDDKESEQHRLDIINQLQITNKKLDETLEQNKQILERIDNVEDHVLTNELDRLRSELYSVGNQCRRKLPLYPEDFQHIRNDYDKYVELGGNHGANIEFDFVCSYYNSQDFTVQN